MFCHSRSSFLICVSYWLGFGLATTAEAGQLRGNADVREEIKGAIALAGKKPFSQKASDKFLDLPAEQVVPELVRALREDPDFATGRTRVFGYLILKQKEAANTEIGYEQLIAGLDEPFDGGLYDSSVGETCIGALAGCPPSKRIEVLARFQEMLRDNGTHARWRKAILGKLARWKDATPSLQKEVLAILVAELDNTNASEDTKQTIIRGLSGYGHGKLGWGKSARPGLQSIETIFADRTAGDRLRASAASALLNIGGLEHALKHFQNIDPEGERIAMLHLLAFISQANEDCHYQPKGKYRKGRADARKLVLQTLKSPNEDSRFAATQALFYAFGKDFLVFHSPTEYEWNQEIRATLDALRDDTHPRIRAGVEQYFSLDLDEAAKRHLRRERRYEKQRLEQQRLQENVKSLP